MSKRVQYAQSFPVLASNPTAETDRVIFFARTDGLYGRLADGTVVGPLSGPPAAVVGGAIPAARVALPTPSSVTMGATGQGGTFEDLPGLSVQLTVAADVPLYVLAPMAVSTVSGNNATEVAVRVVVSSVPEQQGNATRVIIPRSAELNTAVASLLTAPLPPGTYTAKAQWRRVSGSSLPEVTTGSLFAQAQQAPKGDKGDKGDPGTNGTDGAPGAPGRDGGITLDTEQSITGIKHFASGTLLMSSPFATDVEPYSDANPPETLMLKETTVVPATPANLLSVMYMDTSGRLFVKHHDGTINEITNQAATGSAGAGPTYMLNNDYSDTTPTAPVTGVTLFTRHRARRMLSQIGPTGLDTSLQPAIFSNRIARWNAVNNGAPTVDGFLAVNYSTPAALQNAATNFYTSMVRNRFASATQAGNAAGVRTAAQWHMSTVGNKGGFFFVCRFGLGLTTATNRVFVGLASTAAALPNAEPSTWSNAVGFSSNSTQPTLRFTRNDASGTATQIDLGTNFGVNAAAAGVNFYEVRLFSPSGGGSQLHWSAQRLNDGVMQQGTVTTDLPALDVLLAAHVWHQNGTTASAVNLDLQSLYIESDN